jgi:uncharacterized membrane protein
MAGIPEGGTDTAPLLMVAAFSLAMAVIAVLRHKTAAAVFLGTVFALSAILLLLAVYKPGQKGMRQQ